MTAARNRLDRNEDDTGRKEGLTDAGVIIDLEVRDPGYGQRQEWNERVQGLVYVARINPIQYEYDRTRLTGSICAAD